MSSTPLYLDIRIPIITARVLLITTALISIIFTVLLPFSFLSFNYFYNILIPIPNIELPISNYILNYDFTNIPPFIIIGKTMTPLYANQPKNELNELFNDFDFDLNYNINFKFNAFCEQDLKKYETFMYKISIVSTHLVDQLSPYGTRSYISKRFNLWPLTNNIHQLQNPQVLVSSMNSFILNCHDDNTYQKGIAIKEFIPPIFKWLLPPILSNSEINSKDSRFEINLLNDVKFSDYLTPLNENYFHNGEFNILLEFNKPNIIIDPSKSEISINVSWNGIRYYLYHYRIISYIIGTLLLWSASSIILISTVSGLVLWRESTVEENIGDDTIFDDDDNNNNDNNDNEQDESQQPIIIRGDKTSGYSGSIPAQNLNFTINVTEE